MYSALINDLIRKPGSSSSAEDARPFIEQKTALVTGAGGSIGTALAKQILKLSPTTLLLLDHSEYHLYQITRQLREFAGSACQIVPILGDLRDRPIVISALRAYHPNLIFHTAAYKHIDLGETNQAAMILNNLWGTRLLFDWCQEVGTERFVFVSTDKAVRPNSVLGATKRICELLVSKTGQQTGKAYGSVRFGNVAGSRGSLIPLLIEQIEKGGPITITDPKMERYFMTVEDAVLLTLRSLKVSVPGAISILKCGEPLNIMELVQRLIVLMGKRIADFDVQLIGPRKGEKLTEKLYTSRSEIFSEHGDIVNLLYPDLDEVLERHEIEAALNQVMQQIELMDIGSATRQLLALVNKIDNELLEQGGSVRADIPCQPLSAPAQNITLKSRKG